MTHVRRGRPTAARQPAGGEQHVRRILEHATPAATFGETNETKRQRREAAEDAAISAWAACWGS